MVQSEQQTGDKSIVGEKSQLKTTKYQLGTGMVEYALLVACIALLVILPLSRLGARTTQSFRKVSGTLMVFGSGGYNE